MNQWSAVGSGLSSYVQRCGNSRSRRRLEMLMTADRPWGRGCRNRPDFRLRRKRWYLSRGLANESRRVVDHCRPAQVSVCGASGKSRFILRVHLGTTFRFAVDAGFVRDFLLGFSTSALNPVLALFSVKACTVGAPGSASRKSAMLAALGASLRPSLVDLSTMITLSSVGRMSVDAG